MTVRDLVSLLVVLPPQAEVDIEVLGDTTSGVVRGVYVGQLRSVRGNEFGVVTLSQELPCTTGVSMNYTQPVRPDNWNDNTVPPMTHPYASGWEQPDDANFIIDDTTAKMSRADFDRLYEYSTTMPSGVYEGKMWKALARKSVPDLPIEEWPLRWTLRWYGYSKIGVGHVSNNQRWIELTDEIPFYVPPESR